MLHTGQTNASAQEISAATKIQAIWRGYKTRQNQAQAHDHTHVMVIQISGMDALLLQLLPPQLQQMALLSMIFGAGHGHSHSHEQNPVQNNGDNNTSAASNNNNNNNNHDDSDDDSDNSVSTSRKPKI